jgi:acyl carrier protein
VTDEREGRPVAGELIGNRLKQIIQDSAGIPARLILNNSSFDDVLAMNSLSLVSVQVSIEAEYEISMSTEELLAANNFHGIVSRVTAKMEARERHGHIGTAL